MEDDCLNNGLLAACDDDGNLRECGEYEEPEVDECILFCAESDCDWTNTWQCPWGTNSEGQWAGDDGSAGYNCCCVHRTSAEEPCGGPEMGN